MIKEEIKNIHRKFLDQYLIMFAIGAKSFDKAILSLSTVSLGFTFAFLKSINHIIFKRLLYFSWSLFILSILSVLLTFIFLQKHSIHRIQFLSSEITEDNNNITETHWTDKLLVILQYICVLSFIFGLILFTIFVAININNLVK